MGVNSREYAMRVGTSEKRGEGRGRRWDALRGGVSSTAARDTWRSGKGRWGGGKEDTVKVRDLACPEHERWMVGTSERVSEVEDDNK